MTAEDLAAEYLDLRERDPALTPESFAARHPGLRDEVLATIRAALEASDLLPPEDGAARHPAMVGPYRVVRVVGRGGMGVVYEVERAGARFAMKRLPLAPILGQRLLERFRRESEILARLSHPHIVRVHDSGIEDETPWLVMDLVEGAPLTDAASALDRDAKLSLVGALARAVHAAHEAGVVHRDLKPQNVIVRRDGSPVLLDFGLGAVEDLPTLTSTGDLLGTPRYMAPEQVRGGAVDRRTDVHGLGLILYEMLAGAPAYPEGSRDEVLAAVRTGRMRRPGRIAKDLPRDLEKVILTAAAFDPRHRYQTAAAMADDIERHLDGRPVLGRPPGAAVRALQWIRLNPARAAAALFALIAIAAGIWLAATPKAPDPGSIRDANAKFHAGVALWLDGKDAAAKEELARALETNPAHESARVLAASLDGQPAPPTLEPGLAAALASLRAGRFDEVRPAVEVHLRAHARDALASVLLGFAALEGRDWERAETELAAAAADLPPSRRVAEARGRAQRRLGRLEEAVASYRQALTIGPETADNWLHLADAYRERQDLAPGLEAAQTAARLLGEESGRGQRMLASFHDLRGDRAKAQEILRRLLARQPKDVEARYNLAYSLDASHEIVEAEASYRRVLELKPDHAMARLNLANIYSGADRGHCKGCDRAYADHPEFLRLEEAGRELIAAIRQDGGRRKALVQNALGIAKRLPDRTGLAKVLSEMTDGKEKTEAVLNLEWLLRRIELNESMPASRGR
jgi:tetratricopeptide (TPR) repeat protein